MAAAESERKILMGKAGQVRITPFAHSLDENPVRKRVRQSLEKVCVLLRNLPIGLRDEQPYMCTRNTVVMVRNPAAHDVEEGA